MVEQFDPWLIEATRNIRITGKHEIRRLSKLFQITELEMEELYLHRLQKGLQLPPLAISSNLLSALAA